MLGGHSANMHDTLINYLYIYIYGHLNYLHV
jgi:hypothetical protein